MLLLPVPSLSWMHAGAPAIPITHGTHNHTNRPFPLALSTTVRTPAVMAGPSMMRDGFSIMPVGKGIVYPAVTFSPHALPTDKTVADRRADLVRH